VLGQAAGFALLVVILTVAAGPSDKPSATGRARGPAVIYVTPACRKTCHARPIYGTLVL
jgi:hypothetical protein